jgi:hypothetical protein
MRIDAVRRYDLFAKILVLIVTPKHNEIRLELIERRAYLVEQIKCFSRWRLAAAVPSLLPHSSRIASGHPLGWRYSSGRRGFCNMRLRIQPIDSSGAANGG